MARTSFELGGPARQCHDKSKTQFTVPAFKEQEQGGLRPNLLIYILDASLNIIHSLLSCHRFSTATNGSMSVGVA